MDKWTTHSLQLEKSTKLIGTRSENNISKVRLVKNHREIFKIHKTYFTNDDINVASEDNEKINNIPKISKVVLKINKQTISIIQFMNMYFNLGSKWDV